MKSNTYETLSDEELLNKRNKLKPILIVMVSILVIMTIISVIALFTVDDKLNPAYMFPIIFLSIVVVFMSNYSGLETEVKRRKLT